MYKFIEIIFYISSTKEKIDISTYLFIIEFTVIVPMTIPITLLFLINVLNFELLFYSLTFIIAYLKLFSYAIKTMNNK